MFPEQFVEVLKAEKAIAILRTDHQGRAARSMEAAIHGGFRILEFTLTIPGAFELIAEFSKRKELVIGAGTVLSVADARKSVEAGATFVVSPVLDPLVVAEARALNVASIPGTHTPTEMWQAYQLGAPLQKLFPAGSTGADYIRSCLGPMPFLRLVPTNNVDHTNAAEYLQAGAYALGFGRCLFSPELVAEERYDQIQDRARTLVASVGAKR
jgi:2-dehydro-3-deoxyphosphogluconate aldolase/(4S)-4-hydroxy-2-oxoglutarate aldolase